MKVALDLEDVLIDHVGTFVDELNAFVEKNHGTGRRFETSDINGWRFQGLREEFARLRGWESDAVQKFLHGDGNGWEGFYPVTDRIWRENPAKMNPLWSDTADQVRSLHRAVESRGGQLHLVTARQGFDDSVRRRVEQLGILDLMDGVIFEAEKQRLDFDFYIDDRPDLHRKLDSGSQLMVDQPWNTRQQLEEPDTRVGDVSEAAEVVDDLCS